MRRLLLPLFSSLFLLATPVAHATTVVKLGFRELTTASAVIVHGSITRVEVVAVNGNPKWLRTQVDVAVAETLAGPERRTLHLEFVGGRRGPWTLAIPGMPSFAVGEEVVLFLEDLGPRPPSQEPRFALTGLGQAKFTVTTDAHGVRHVGRELGDVSWVVRNAPPGALQLDATPPPDTLDALLSAVRAIRGGAR